ncbi:hypothetical protein GCM10020000_84850 [Streptomyces olivoverticillatus]
MVGHFCVASDEIALVDRNCHKSVLHGLVLSGARPVYLVPTRNGYGLVEPPASRRPRCGRHRRPHRRQPLAQGAVSPTPPYAIVTNSTYDGLCYDAVHVTRDLAASTPRLHFDEAWFAYARFHPLYTHRYAMSVDGQILPDEQRPTLFSTQSTHKLLAALSQSAMVHIRTSPRAPVAPEHFNEAFMMHATTSPLYPAIASLDVAAGMMDGPPGPLARRRSGHRSHPLPPGHGPHRHPHRSGRRPPGLVLRDLAAPHGHRPRHQGRAHLRRRPPADLLRTEPSCWQLQPDAAWHGLPGLSQGYCMLDPIKVTLTCPGLDARGQWSERGIPARILTAYLATRNILVEKTDSYTALVLFSMGITKGKWGTLLDALMDFKALYDADTPSRTSCPPSSPAIRAATRA